MAINEKKSLDDIRALLDELTKITPESLVRTKELGEAHDFRAGIKTFKQLLQLFKTLKEANLNEVPGFVLSDVQNSLSGARHIFNLIKQFNPKIGGAIRNRDNLIIEVERFYKEQLQDIQSVISLSGAFNFQILVNRAREGIDEINKVREDIKKESQSSLSKAKEIVDKMRDAAAITGVAAHAVHFREEAVSHHRRGRYWLWATIVLALLTLGFGFYIARYYTINILTTTQAIQIGISKLVIFSIFYFGVLWSGKMYRAHQHNNVVNQHRQNALKTFETFVIAASDSQTKDAVLVQATQSIFSPQLTGFITKESEPSASPKLVEIVRNITGTAK